MASLVATAPILGKVDFVEVYEYYDGPRLFSCQDSAGQLYLALWIGEDLNSDKYLLAALSVARFNMVRSGGIDLRDAFVLTETGSGLVLQVRRNDGETKVEPISARSLDLELLPAAGEKLGLDTKTLPTFHEDVRKEAVARRREVTVLHFDFPGNHRTEAPTRSLGKLLESFQEVLDSIGQSVDGHPTLRGSISPAILDATATSVVRATAASFAVELVAKQPANLLGHSLACDVLDEFTGLLEIGSDDRELRERLTRLKARAAAKYRSFLKSVVDSKSGLKVDWGSVLPEKGRSVVLPHTIAKSVIDIVDQVTVELAEPHEVEGLFRAISLPSKTYEIYVPSEDTKYKGRILDSAMREAQSLTLNKPYRIILREVLEVTAAGEEKVKYEMESIGPSAALV